MITKANLIIGAYYNGKSRNASLARWNGSKFIYMRTKFMDTYPEAINHEEDFSGFDCFKPLTLETDPEFDIPLET